MELSKDSLIDLQKQETLKLVAVAIDAKSKSQQTIDNINKYFEDLADRIKSDVAKGAVSESASMQALRKIREIGTGTTSCGDGDEDNCSHCMDVEEIVNSVLGEDV